MVSTLKTQLCSLLTSLGYKAVDNPVYMENFPWLIIRTNGHQRRESFDTRTDLITLTIDIFSTYNGEKEILDIIEDIGNHIQELKNDNSSIIYITQKTVKILDDKKTGPVRKHGVVSYEFLLSTYEGE